MIETTGVIVEIDMGADEAGTMTDGTAMAVMAVGARNSREGPGMKMTTGVGTTAEDETMRAVDTVGAEVIVAVTVVTVVVAVAAAAVEAGAIEEEEETAEAKRDLELQKGDHRPQRVLCPCLSEDERLQAGTLPHPVMNNIRLCRRNRQVLSILKPYNPF